MPWNELALPRAGFTTLAQTPALAKTLSPLLQYAAIRPCLVAPWGALLHQ